MNGAVELFTACRKHDVKPILGCEAYVVEDHARRAPGKLDRFHLTLIAATPTGYRNLVKLSSAGFLEGFQRGKPSVDLEQIAAHADGVIALTGCLQSRFCQHLLDGRPAEAKAHAEQLLDAFGADNVYFEVQKNGLAEQDRANEGIVRIARELGRPLVGTGDVHYLRREDYHHHAALLCVQTKSTLAEPKITFDNNEFYLRSNEEMAKAFAEWPEALASTIEIAERCDVELELDRQLIPRYPTPDGQSEVEYLRELVQRGSGDRYGDPAPGAGGRARRVRARRDRADGLRRLLPDRLGLRQVREGLGDRRRPGPRLGRGLAGRLLPADHRRRPAALRPAVRALPEPRARVDAGHRHRLLGPRPRARDPLRDRASTARSGSRRSSRSARCSRARRRATRRACSATTTAPATGSRS